MYKTSAVYNAFVCHKETLGTKLEVCLGGQEVIVPLHPSPAERSRSLLEVQNIWMLLGSPFIRTEDTAMSQNNRKPKHSFLNLFCICRIAFEDLHA